MLGRGFLAHPKNDALRAALGSGALSSTDYFGQLMRLGYRLLFLLIVEERRLLHPRDADHAAMARYAAGYSLARLCDRVMHGAANATAAATATAPATATANDECDDLWALSVAVFRGACDGEPQLALPALGGLFAAAQCPALDGAKLGDGAFLDALGRLSCVHAGDAVVRTSWCKLGPEALGSVYESLLELDPRLSHDGREFTLAPAEEATGHARRRSGSYFTPDNLVQALLDGALEPAIADALARQPVSPREALLALTIVDPACGSGHVLLAAARRLAAHVARHSTNDTPSAAEARQARGEVISRCVFGVDLDPMAVELCKLSLWLEAAEPGVPLGFLDAQVRQGNALVGATPELVAAGIPDAAWAPREGGDRETARSLKQRNRARRAMGTPLPTQQDPTLAADAWCAAFFWPHQPGALAAAAPTNDVWRELSDGAHPAHALTVTTTAALALQHRFFHWHLAFPQVLAAGGFDVALGNPPWIAHAGRAAQPLPPGARQFHVATSEAFADYPTTHGLFASVVPRMLRIGGRLGLVLPSSLSELAGYAPTRRAHDRLCDFDGELTDFGEGRFVGVTQPCMALISRRAISGRQDAVPGAAWPMARPELTATDRQLLARLAALPTVPSALFGERGVQSDRTLAEHFVASSVPTGRFDVPIREGTDVREFELAPPRLHVDRDRLGARLRAPEQFREVRVVIRQTARFPIAALSDGLAFRNSLLAGFELPAWPALATVALLNSALVRWAHYMRFRDARQLVLPQVKIGHLRAIPLPSGDLDALATVGRQLHACAGPPERATLREGLDRLVAELFQLTPEERAAVAQWHRTMTAGRASLPPGARRAPRIGA